MVSAKWQGLHVIDWDVPDADALSAAWLLLCEEIDALAARLLSRDHAAGREAHLTRDRSAVALSQQAKFLCRVAVTALQLPSAGQPCYSWSEARPLWQWQSCRSHSMYAVPGFQHLASC